MANVVQGQMRKPMGMKPAANMSGSKMGMVNEPKNSKKWLWWTLGIIGLLIVVWLVWWIISG